MTLAQVVGCSDGPGLEPGKGVVNPTKLMTKRGEEGEEMLGRQEDPLPIYDSPIQPKEQGNWLYLSVWLHPLNPSPEMEVVH